MTIEPDVHYHGVCESDVCGGANRTTNTVNDGHDSRPDTGAPRCLNCGADLTSVEKHLPETIQDQIDRGVAHEGASATDVRPVEERGLDATPAPTEPAIDTETGKPQQGPYNTVQFDPAVPSAQVPPRDAEAPVGTRTAAETSVDTAERQADQETQTAERDTSPDGASDQETSGPNVPPSEQE